MISSRFHQSSRSARRTRRSTLLTCTQRIQLSAAKRKVRVPLSSRINMHTPRCAIRLHLPRVLLKPDVNEVNRSAIERCCPDLVEVPTQFIRDSLAITGPQMLHTLHSIHSELPKSHLPKELDVVINDMAASSCPTHMLAVWSRGSTSHPQSVTLYPTHALVLTSHCANLPALPISNLTSTSTTTTLPVVPLQLPSAETFPILQGYLYTKNDEALLASLLSKQDGEQQLLRSAMRIHGIWQNACALGVCDEGIWDVIQKAWENVLGVLESSS